MKKSSQGRGAVADKITTGDGTEIPIRTSFSRLAPLESLRPYPKNPNEHDPEQLKVYKAILLGLGIRRPAIVSKRSGFITCGNGAFMAARELGCTHWPVDEQDYKDDAEEMAHVIADNQLPRLSNFEEAKIAEMLREMDGKIDLALSGFSRDEVANLLEATPAEIEKTLRQKRVKIDWGKFQIFHCAVGEQIYCLNRLNWLVSYGTMDGKAPNRQRPPDCTVFVDSGMLTLARKIGMKALKKQKAVIEYAEDIGGDWVTMMDIPLVPAILDALKLKKSAAQKLHLENAAEFASLKTKLRKVFVIQGQTLRDYEQCCEDMRPFIDPEAVLAIGSIKDRADNPELVAAITAKVHAAFPEHRIHLFGITNPKTVKLAVQYGATSSDSSTAGNSVARGECLFAKKTPEGYAVGKQTIAEMIGEPNLSVGGKLWLAMTAFSMAQVEAALALSMVMEETALVAEAGGIIPTGEEPPPLADEPDPNINA